MNKCLECKDLTSNPKFCCRSCSTKFHNRGKRRHGKEPPNCLQCGRRLQGSSRKYCSHWCEKQHKYEQFIFRWKMGLEDGSPLKGIRNPVRRYIKEKWGDICWKCGWCEIHSVTRKVPVEVHHIDGDHRNGHEENLELLCPNCHSLTPTYRALNKGKGRKYRTATVV